MDSALMTSAIGSGTAIGHYLGLNGSFRSQSIKNCLSGHDNIADIPPGQRERPLCAPISVIGACPDGNQTRTSIRNRLNG